MFVHEKNDGTSGLLLLTLTFVHIAYVQIHSIAFKNYQDYQQKLKF